MHIYRLYVYKMPKKDCVRTKFYLSMSLFGRKCRVNILMWYIIFSGWFFAVELIARQFAKKKKQKTIEWLKGKTCMAFFVWLRFIYIKFWFVRILKATTLTADGFGLFFLSLTYAKYIEIRVLHLIMWYTSIGSIEQLTVHFVEWNASKFMCSNANDCFMHAKKWHCHSEKSIFNAFYMRKKVCNYCVPFHFADSLKKVQTYELYGCTLRCFVSNTSIEFCRCM